MNDRVLIRTGAAGAVFAEICCATPLLSVLLPFVGLGAWLAGADLVLLPLLAASVGVMACGLHRRGANADCHVTAIHQEGAKQ